MSTSFAVLLLIAALALAWQQRVATARLRARYSSEAGAIVDAETGLLLPSALPFYVPRQLEWARYSGKHIGFVVFDLRGPAPEVAARTLRAAMRTYELAFMLHQRRLLLALWDVDHDSLAEAALRLGRQMEQSGPFVVQAGTSMYPDDGRDTEALLAAALSGQQLLNRRGAALSVGAFLACYPLIGGIEVGSKLALELLTALTLAGACLILLHARVFAAIRSQFLLVAGLALFALSLGLAELGIDGETFALDTVCKLLAAGCWGAALARSVDRFAWIVSIAVFAAALDAWSVYASNGPTRMAVDRMIQEPTSTFSQWASTLFVFGPYSDAGRVFLMGLTDVVFVSAFICVGSIWGGRGVRTAAACATALWVGHVVGRWSDMTTPLLPFLAVAFVAINARLLWSELRGQPLRIVSRHPHERPVEQ